MTSQCGDSGMVRMCRLPRRIMIIMIMMIVRKTVELSLIHYALCNFAKICCQL